MTISKKSMKWIPWLLVLPVVIIRGFTTLYPILMTVKNSFCDIRILAGVDEFCGFKNYLKVFSDPKVLTSIRFTVVFVVVSMILHVILGVCLALILNMKFKGRRFLRTIVLIPWAMPAVVVGGPGEDTALIAYRITTEAFTNLNVGYASALAMLLFVVMAVFSWLNIHVMNKIDN